MIAVLKLQGISRRHLFEAFFTIGGRIVSVLIIIATTKFLTNYLSEAAYGQLALYTITATLPSTFFFGPLGQGIMRLFPVAKEKNELGLFHSQYQQIFKKGAHFILATGVIASLVCWSAGASKWAMACLLIALFNVVNSLNVLRYGLQNSARKRILALGLETGDRLMQQTVAIGLLLFVSNDPLMVIAGYVLASLIFLLINQRFYRRSFPETQSVSSAHIENGYSKNILRYSWPFIVFGIFTWFQNASDRWTLALLQSAESVGQYAVLNQIGFQSLGLVFGSIGYFLTPILFNKAGNLLNSRRVEEANQVNNLFLWFNVLFTLFLFLIFWFFGKEIILLLSSPKYEDVANLLPLMVLAGGVFNFGQNYANRFMLSMKTQMLLIPKITAAVIGVVLNIAGAFWFGLKGLIVSVLAAQVVYLLVMLITWESIKKRSL